MAKLFGIEFGGKDPYATPEASEVKPKRSLKESIPTKFPSFSKKGKKVSPEAERIRKETIAETFQHSLPATNSVNPAVLGKYSQKELIRKYINTGIVVAALFGILFAGNTINTWVQNRSLDDLRATGTDKTAVIGTLTQYSKYKTDVAGKITAVSTNLVNDVDVQQIVDFTYTEAAKQNIDITSVGIKIATSATDTGSCMPSDPFATSSAFIGCVTVEGNQPNANAVINFFNSISGHTGFQDTFVSSTTYGSEKNSFAGSFSFTNKLFSQRYTAMKSQNIDSILTNGLNIGKPITTNQATATPSATPAPAVKTSPTATATPVAPTATATPVAPTATATPNPTNTAKGNQ